MEEEKIEETIDNPEESETPEEKADNEDEATSEKPEVDVEEVKSQRDKLYARLKKEEEKRKSLEAELKKSVKPVSEETVDEWKMKVDFLLHNKDVSEDEFDHIATVASRKGISLSDAKEQEKDYIQYQREKVEKEKKIPDSTSTDFSSFGKKISSDTPPEEVDKILKERFEKSQESTKSV